MIGKQLLKEEIVELIVSGSGTDIRDATRDIFKKIQKEIYKEVEYPIIQMDTEAVYYDEISYGKKNSRFLKKESNTVSVTARILLKIKYLEIEEGENYEL